jgi:hypothetical protein
MKFRRDFSADAICGDSQKYYKREKEKDLVATGILPVIHE